VIKKNFDNKLTLKVSLYFQPGLIGSKARAQLPVVTEHVTDYVIVPPDVTSIALATLLKYCRAQALSFVCNVFPLNAVNY